VQLALLHEEHGGDLQQLLRHGLEDVVLDDGLHCSASASD
jgi:hypothetical protein